MHLTGQFLKYWAIAAVAASALLIGVGALFLLFPQLFLQILLCATGGILLTCGLAGLVGFLYRLAGSKDD